jgi:hypothetical protein
VDERSYRERERWAPPYEELRSVRIPEAIPELAIEAGDTGCIDSVYALEDGTLALLVDVSGPGAPCGALKDVEVLPDGRSRVAGFSRLGL